MVLSERHGPPSFREHVRSWSTTHQEDIQTVLSDITDPSKKAVFIEGTIYAGKSTLAAAVAQQLPEEWDINVTIAQSQDAFTPSTIKDERTGGIYKNLPPAETIDKPTLIIIDEIKKTKPRKNFWKSYIDNPQTQFILLSQEKNPHMGAWKQLFEDRSEQQTKAPHYQITP